MNLHVITATCLKVTGKGKTLLQLEHPQVCDQIVRLVNGLLCAIQLYSWVKGGGRDFSLTLYKHFISPLR